MEWRGGDLGVAWRLIDEWTAFGKTTGGLKYARRGDPPATMASFSDFPPEDHRICRLVLDETIRAMAGQRVFSLYLVGSRATGEASPLSDFDFVIDAGEALPSRIINPLRENLELLPVGHGIDLVDWHQCSDQFRELAGAQRMALAGGTLSQEIDQPFRKSLLSQ
jgi:predicted nucleotidyltransferase